MPSALDTETTDLSRSDLYGSEVSVAERETHIATDRARAGSTPHIVRYVLGISLILVIVAMIVIVGFGAK